MSITLQAQTIDARQEQFHIDVFPDRCPQCHTAVNPKLLSQHFSATKSETYLTFLCTSNRCLRPFIATYKQLHPGRNEYHLSSTAPRVAARSSFPDTVKGLSPTFCEICAQVETAKADNLDQLVGIGLRKGIEFLVKDFAKSEHPDSTKAIESMALGGCIDTYISDQNILQCAKRAAWLGNDETHYIRKWSDKDLSDLQLLVRLTVNWVDNFMLTKKYIGEMPDGA